MIWLGGDALVEEGTALAETGDLGRGQVLGLWGLLFLSLLAARTVAREVARSLTSTERCLVLGGAEAAKRVDVESPHTEVTGLLERVVFEPQSRGFRPLLAHPERCPSFLRDLPRLERLVERGVLCSVTAGSMQGKFGTTVQRFTATLFAPGLVHNVASDSHDARRRPPGLRQAFWAMERLLPGLGNQSEWFTTEVPTAILAGREIPARPAMVEQQRRGLRRLVGGTKRVAQPSRAGAG